MRLYLGSTALIFASGLAIGALLGWALTRWYFLRLLRCYAHRLHGLLNRCYRCGSTDLEPGVILPSYPPQHICRRCYARAEPQAAADLEAGRAAWDDVMPPAPDPSLSGDIETELRRRKL